MLKTNQEFPQKSSFQIKQDDKFFGRLLSKESSTANPSFRVYYNGSVSVAVPFVWESEPGTPKHAFHETNLPPLTPPPSYFLSQAVVKKPTKKNSSSRSNLLHYLFSRMVSKKISAVSSSSLTSSTLSSTPSSSSLSSSNYSFNTPRKHWNEHRRYSSRGSSFDSWKGYEDYVEDDDDVSPTSTLCFGLRRVASTSSGGFRQGGL